LTEKEIDRIFETTVQKEASLCDITDDYTVTPFTQPERHSQHHQRGDRGGELKNASKSKNKSSNKPKFQKPAREDNRQHVAPTQAVSKKERVYCSEDLPAPVVHVPLPVLTKEVSEVKAETEFDHSEHQDCEGYEEALANFEQEEEASQTYLNDPNVFPRASGANEEALQFEKDFMLEGKKLEQQALGGPAAEVEDKADGSGPAVLTQHPSALALDFIQQLNAAAEAKDGEALSNLVFDADVEGLAKEIDLNWYEQKAARLMESMEL